MSEVSTKGILMAGKDKKIDYNLLRVYLFIYKYRNLSLVAKHLGCTDGAVSKMLSKLRDGFGDPLFVRHASGFEPTAFTEWLAPKIEVKLTELEVVIEKAIESSYQIDRVVTISLLSTDVDLFGDTLYTQLIDTFPNVKFDIVTWGMSTLDRIAIKEVDFAIGLAIENNSKLCYQTLLFQSAAKLILPDSISVSNWQDCFQYRTLNPLILGWNSKKNPIIDKFNECGIPFGFNKLTDVDNINLANRIMLSQRQTTPCGIGLFAYQVDRFKQIVNREVKVIDPMVFGEYNHQPYFDVSLYEYSGNRGNHFYEQVKAILIKIVKPPA